MGVFPSLSIKRIYEKKKRRWVFNGFIWYLKRKGYIKVQSLEPSAAIIITSKGIEKILKITLKKTIKKRRKDGKWIMAIFDIPEKKRSLRDFLREALQALGFKFLQKSIWVCPYDVLKEVQGVIQRYDLERYVNLFLIEEIKTKTSNL